MLAWNILASAPQLSLASAPAATGARFNCDRKTQPYEEEMVCSNAEQTEADPFAPWRAAVTGLVGTTNVETVS
jgi:uncharacterized protein